MRLSLAVLLLSFSAGAWGQLRSTETRALDDAMTLANVRSGDLGSVAPPPNALATHSEALRDPLAGLAQAVARHEHATGDAASLLATEFALLGGIAPRASKGEVAEVPSTVPVALRRPVGILVAAISTADDEIRASLVRLSPTERRTLIEGLPRLAADDPSLPLDFAHGPPADFATLRRLLDLVDTRRIEAAGVALAAVVRETLPSLQAVPKTTMKPLLFRSREVLVELSGTEPDIHSRKDVALCIDLGGDDRYTGRYGAGVGYAGVLIDLGGNDRYLCSDVSVGAGLLGIGLAYDLGGDDVYGVRNVGLGCGIAGVGLLEDSSGDDRYRVAALGLGAGVRGIGLLDDRLGDDAYDADRAGEGYGDLSGVGWSVDGAGDDTYRGGEWVQATGRDGGFGLLTDLGGNDSYRAVSGQAAAFGGYASLGDLRGDDTYIASGRAQGFASEGGFAALIDEAGDDAYLLRRGPGQASAFGGTAILFDREGNDVYGGTDGSPATAIDGGVALFLEGAGDDRYLSSAPFRRDSDGIALWADAGGRDRYGDGRGDAQADAALDAVAYDAFGAPDGAPPITPLPAPGSIPMPPSAEFASLRRQAVDGPDRASAIARLVGIGVPALEALSADPDDSFVAVASRMGLAATPVVERLAVSPDPRVARVGLEVAGYVPVPPETIVAGLDRPGLAVVAAKAAGRSKAVIAIPALARWVRSTDLASRRAAMEALAAIASPAGVAIAATSVDDADPFVRRAAFRLVALDSAVAYSTGARLAASGDAFRQRIGLSLLGASGSPQAFAAIRPYLQGDRDAKIGALLAIEGKVPADLIAAVDALRRDPDPLVRAVAERTDVGP